MATSVRISGGFFSSFLADSSAAGTWAMRPAALATARGRGTVDWLNSA